MFKVRIFNQIAKQGLAQLEHAGLIIDDENPNAILLRSQNLHDYAFSKDILAVVRAGAGVNNIPVQSLTEKGIAVFNTPGANANAVKELVLASLVMSSRNLVEACLGLKSLTKLKGNDLSLAVEKHKKAYKGQEIKGKTLAVIGLGAIGGKVANDAIALGLKVIGYDSHLTVDNALRLSRDVVRANSLGEALQKADFISLHIPYLKSTHHLINETIFKQMAKGSVLLNFARADIVDESALLAAIKAGIVKKYITDFPSDGLLKDENVLAFPHLGASTKEAEDNCAMMAVNQLVQFLKTGEVKNAINFPSLSLPSCTPFRLAISNRNEPNMLGQIASTLADLQLNIVEMSNRSLGDLAYNLIDVDEAPTQACFEKMAKIDGILNCRYIEM